MLPRQIRCRKGFTLLEITLAASIGLVLLWGLYVAMDVQLSQAHVGRELIEHGKIARSLFRGITSDINSNLGAFDPRMLPSSGSTEAPASAAPASATPTPSTSDATANSAAATDASAAATTPESSSEPATDGAVAFNVGVQGGSDWLMLTAGRVPRELAMFQRDASKGQLASDLRRITYWVVEEGGLARHETTRVTASDLPATPDDIPDPFSCVLAREVIAVTFEYFNGSGWQSTWSGTDPGEDGETPIGPPAAIAVTLTIQRGQPNADGQLQSVNYRHVVVIPSANSLIPPAEAP
jgi:hypothetical protein